MSKMTKSQMEVRITALEAQLAAIKKLTGWRSCFGGYSLRPAVAVPLDVPYASDLRDAINDRVSCEAGEGDLQSVVDGVSTYRHVVQVAGTHYAVEYTLSDQDGTYTEIKGVAVPAFVPELA
jgi:hypothetical protein